LWAMVSGDIPTASLWCVSIDSLAPDIVYAGSFFDGAFKSVNAGIDWYAINSGLQPYQGATWVFDFAIDPLNPEIIYTAIDGTGVFISTDRGETWTPMSLGLGNKAMYALVLDPNDPSVLFVGTQMGAYKWYGDPTVDIFPSVIHKKSKGEWVTGYIEIPVDYDPEQINVGTVMLNGIVPAASRPVAVGDYDHDGVRDLMVKFKGDAVRAILQPGNEVEIRVTGQLYSGTRFVAIGTVRVTGK